MKKNPGRKERRMLERANRREWNKAAALHMQRIQQIEAKKRKKPIFRVRLLRFLTCRDILTGEKK